MSEMEEKWQFSRALGKMDGYHIQIKCSSGGSEASIMKGVLWF